MKLTRILSAALAGVMLFSCAALSGCRKKQVAEKTTVDHVYRVTTLQKPEGMGYARQLFVSGERIYMSYNYYDEITGTRENRTYSMALDGTDAKQETIPALEAPKSEDENTHINVQNLIPAADGSVWRTVYYSQYNRETGEQSEKTMLERVLLDGTEMLSIDCEEFWGPPSENPEERVWHYVDYLTPVDGGVIFLDNQQLYYVSDTGKLECRLDIAAQTSGDGWMQSIFSTPGGPVLLYSDYSSGRQKLSLYPLNVDAGTLGTPVELDSTVFQNVYNFFSGPDYTFYYNDNDALYGYDLATNTSTMLMNFLNSDISSNSVSRVVVISKDLFIANGYDDVTSEQQLMRMERVPEEELVPKYILTLATLGDTWSAQSDVIRFNRQSDEYRIVIRNYDPQDYYVDTTKEYVYEDMVQQALTALNNDLIAGKVPDILLVNEYIQMDNYISKGLFADLYAYIDKDERFKREDFLFNVLDAYTINGKLYELAPSFNVQTLVGKKSMVGDRTGWTMKEFVEWSKTIPEGAVVFYEMTRDSLLEMFCIYAYEEFVDPDTGECHFDSEDFKLILEYVNTLSTKTFWEEMEQNGSMNNNQFWQEYENRYRDDKAMLEQLYLSNFTALTSAMNYTFYTEEELVMVGLPSMDRSGSVITASPTYAMSAQSPLTDGAWQFVSMFITEEYQDSLNHKFPLRLSSLEKMADKAVEEQERQKKAYEERMANQGNDKYYYGDAIVTMPAVPAVAVPTSIETAAAAVEIAVETSAAVEVTAAETTAAAETEAPKTEETTGPADANGDGIMDDDIAPAPVVRQQNPRTFLDREMADEIIAFLKTLNHARRNNTKVNNIIKEEAAAYFAGQKPLEETVKLIQNRVSTVVAESR